MYQPTRNMIVETTQVIKSVGGFTSIMQTDNLDSLLKVWRMLGIPEKNLKELQESGFTEYGMRRIWIKKSHDGLESQEKK